MQILWVFSFEYAGIIKVGGLGEVPANQTKWLADQYDITLFMPSHGVHQNPEISKKLNLKKLDHEFHGRFDAQKIGLGGTKENIHIEYYQGEINGIKVILLAGGNPYSSHILNDPIVYSSETLPGKFILYSLGMKSFITYTLNEEEKKLPNIIHLHDHHGVPALMCCRQVMLKENKDVATLITIHLMSWPRYSYDFLLTSGVENSEFDVFIGGEHESFDLEGFYRLCKGSEKNEPTLEKIGVFFADMVTSVSEDYALSNVVGHLGGGWVSPKTSFIWNGCDWDYFSIQESVKQNYSEKLKYFSKNPDENLWYSRKNLRKFLLTRGFSQMKESEPIIPSKKIQSYLHKQLTFFPFLKDKNGKFRGKLANFFEDGPLVITTGRISSQKGIDLLLDAIPLVLKKHPDAKFILSVLPTEYSIPEIDSYIGRIKKYKNNIRMIFGKVISLFFLMHIAADIYCAPSRWEPFGITGLEASVTKNLVVASHTGGLQEIVLDIKDAKENATGMLFPIEDIKALANAINDLITAVKFEETYNSGLKLSARKYDALIQSITNLTLKEMIQKHPNYPTQLRENAHNRVERHFRWEKVTQKLPKLYDQAIYNRGKRI